MKVFQKNLKNLSQGRLSLTPAQTALFSSQASFVQRWSKINDEAMLGGGAKRIEKQHA